MNDSVDESPLHDLTSARGAEPSHDLSAAASQLRMATFRLARRLRAQRAVDTMSDGQFAVLAALTVHGAHTLGQLADRERVTAPSMNRTVSLLEEAGYVTRTPDEVDRRKVTIDLTDDGRTVVDETVRRRDAWLEEALAGLSPDDRRTLAQAAEIMRKVAER
ncbi:MULTISPECIES: MarR family winged helix-turn-helix transcriptional regulator [unclassified Microbacterium]|uniref:MarR family winged helix-turn-helix transcriptional regulator n=1 Tax=unclassified Microbacterium TaxID=2609290 RepID=UPI0006FD4728|nr:MarR family transcriptional regulator [Microbacterium sp. Leaf179]KQT75596.1 MarR family transcriptional regulator [Microbacterium sp. Leaf436]